MDLRGVASRIATDEFPKRIQIKSPYWAPGPPWPAGQGYEEWEDRHGWHSESKYGDVSPEIFEKRPDFGKCKYCEKPDPNVELIDTEELLVTVTEQAHELIEGTGCVRSPDDPAHDPDKMWIDCPDQESYDKLINLFESSRFRAKNDDVYWWLWTTWRDAEIMEVPLSQKDYEAEHFLRSRDVKPPGWVPELKVIPGGRESFDLRGVASRVAILMAPSVDKSKVTIEADETHQYGTITIEWDDGTAIIGEYLISGGKAGSIEILINTSDYSEEQAAKLLYAAHDYWAEEDLDRYSVDELEKRAGI